MKVPILLGALAGIIFWIGFLIGDQHDDREECKTPITFETVWFDDRSVSVVSNDGQYLSCGFGPGQFVPYEQHELVGSMGYKITIGAPIIITGDLKIDHINENP